MTGLRAKLAMMSYLLYQVTITFQEKLDKNHVSLSAKSLKKRRLNIIDMRRCTETSELESGRLA